MFLLSQHLIEIKQPHCSSRWKLWLFASSIYLQNRENKTRNLTYLKQIRWNKKENKKKSKKKGSNPTIKGRYVRQLSFSWCCWGVYHQQHHLLLRSSNGTMMWPRWERPGKTLRIVAYSSYPPHLSTSLSSSPSLCLSNLSDVCDLGLWVFLKGERTICGY